MSSRKNILIVTAHKAEGSVLAAAISNCGKGPSPYSHSGGSFRILVAGTDQRIFISQLQKIDISAFTHAVLFGAAGGLSDLPEIGNLYNCNPVVILNGRSLSSTFSLLLPELSIASSDKPLIDKNSRSAFQKKTGAHLVDIEGETFAEFFSEKRLPWAIVRFVSDTPAHPFDFPFPKVIQEKMRVAGKNLIGALSAHFD